MFIEILHLKMFACRSDCIWSVTVFASTGLLNLVTKCLLTWYIQLGKTCLSRLSRYDVKSAETGLGMHVKKFSIVFVADFSYTIVRVIMSYDICYCITLIFLELILSEKV
jgi:hypothetical protein